MDNQVYFEKNLLIFFRGLIKESNLIKTFEQIPFILEEVKNQVKSVNDKEFTINIYGILAEELAFLLLSMYMQYYPESKIFRNVIIEYESNKTTEIDLMFLTKNILYFIEVKHRSVDLSVNADYSLITVDKEEFNPVYQNIGHINRLLKTMQYGNTIPFSRVKNLIFLVLGNNAKLKLYQNQTIFDFDSIQGAFTNYKNLLPIINKFEKENDGGKLQIERLYKDIKKLSSPYDNKEGKEQHIKNLKERNKK